MNNIAPSAIQLPPSYDDFSVFIGISSLTLLSQKAVDSARYLESKLYPAIKDNSRNKSVEEFGQFLIKVNYDIKVFNHWSKNNDELNHLPSAGEFENALTLLRRNIALSEDMHERYLGICANPGCFKTSNRAYNRLMYFVSVQRHLKKVVEEVYRYEHKS